MNNEAFTEFTLIYLWPVEQCLYDLLTTAEAHGIDVVDLWNDEHDSATIDAAVERLENNGMIVKYTEDHIVIMG